MENRNIHSPSDTSPQRSPEDHEEWPELLPQSWTIPSALRRWYERRHDFTAEEKKKAWDETAKIVKDYSDELVKRWKEEIDTLLVYAGLFSAVLTALIVESYKLLSPPPPDPVLIALQQISAQLSSFSLVPPFVNSTQPIVSQALPPAPPTPRWAVWLNALWFSSLIFSLSAASVGIMVKQWLNEYSTGLFGDSRQFARLRQHRLQNLERWHVAEIVAILPILLQIALALFFGGLLVFLWMLNSDVAAVASALVGLLFSFTIGSSIIPIFRADCCFLSPPVYVFFSVVRAAMVAIIHVVLLLWIWLHRIRRVVQCSNERSSDEGRSDDITVLYSAFLSAKDDFRMLTWRGRELKQISGSCGDLDVTMVMKAYASTMDQSYLDNYAAICVSDFLQPSQVVDCYRGLASEMDRHQLIKDDIPLTIGSELWLAIKHPTELINRDGLPDMDQLWVDYYISTGASIHSRNHIWANALFDGNTSVAYEQVVKYLNHEEYDHCSNTVRRRALRVVEQELREHGQKAEEKSLKRCSLGLRMLLRWVGACSRAKDTQPEDTELAQAIRALTHHGLLCHFKHYTTEAGKTLSLVDNYILIHVILWIRKLCEIEAPDFITPELVDALLRLYKVHQAEFESRNLDLERCKLWILKLKREHDESRNNDRDSTSRGEAQLSAAAEDSHGPAAATRESVIEQPHLETHTSESSAHDVHEEELQRALATSTRSPVLSSSSD